MITSKSYMTLTYLLSIIFFLNYTSPFIFWIMTELNLILFIFIMMGFGSVGFKQEVHDLVMFYFIIQSMASILILSNFFFSSNFYIFNSDVMFISAMLIKLGIFPFFFWIYKISQFLNKNSLSILLTLQKVPFFLSLFNSFNSYLSLILFFSFVSGCILIFYSLDLVFLIVSSSVASSYWIFYLYNYSLFFFFLYFLLYSVFIFSLLYTICSRSMNSFDFLFSIFLFMFLLGLSPLSLFFFKLYTMFFFLLNYKILEVGLFWAFSFMCLFGYMKFSFKTFFFNFGIYYKLNFFLPKSLFFFFSLSTFFLFLLY